jgi:ABC-2 type transport system ATP-binding protein
MTAYENLDFYGGLYQLKKAARRERITEILRLLSLEEQRNVPAANLSGGWRQKLALGCAVLHKPALLFLDEATSGADPNNRRLFWQLIYRFAAAGTTVLVTTHFLEEAEHCDRIAFIYSGRLIADDTPRKLKDRLPGRICRIKSSDPVGLLGLLKKETPLLLDAYIHGESVRVRLPDKEAGALAAWRPEPVRPSLEDVFIYLSNREAGSPGEAASPSF